MQTEVVITFFEDTPLKVAEELAQQIAGALKTNELTQHIDEHVETVVVRPTARIILDNAEEYAEVEEDK